VVVEKLLASPVYRDRLEKDKDTLNRFAEVLANPSEIKKTYLTSDWAETLSFVIISVVTYARWTN
jgi:hypothetical protein